MPFPTSQFYHTPVFHQLNYRAYPEENFNTFFQIYDSKINYQIYFITLTFYQFPLELAFQITF